MGYILPVHNFQYSQYAERDTGHEFNPLQVMQVEGIRKEAPVQKGTERFPTGEAMVTGSRMGQMAYRRKRIDKSIIEKNYAELTGKGQYFSITV